LLLLNFDFCGDLPDDFLHVGGGCDERKNEEAFSHSPCGELCV
jgi:hypothetical protein